MGKNNKRQSSFRRNSRVQFDRRGSFKKSKRSDNNFESDEGAFNADETVYRILCPVKKIGSVIGKGGDIIKALREETRSKIKVGESVPGTDERVVIIFSSSTEKPKILDSNENEENPENVVTAEEEHDEMQPHCPAQHALLKVHQRISEDDGLFGGPVREDNNEDDVVTARLLVPSNQVGCLIGKGGHVIQSLRTETGANIRILPADHLPACAMSTDELVQISGISAIAKKALYEVSTLLHQNPRPPMKNPIHDGGQGFYPPAPMGNMPPLGNQMSQHSTPEAEERAILVSSIDAPWNPISPTIEAILQLQVKTNVISEEGTITTRLLVPSSKVGCLLGQGGHIINEMRRRTLADIRVISKDGKPNYASADEELVQVSGNVNVARDALVEVAQRLRMRSLEGVNGDAGPMGPMRGFGHPESFPDRRMPPSGMIARNSGSYEHVKALWCDQKLSEATIVNGNGYARRKSTNIYSYNQRVDRCQSRDEGFSTNRHGSALVPQSNSGKGGGREYQAPRYPAQPTPSRFPNISSSMQIRIPNSAISSVLGAGGSNISNIGQMSGAKVKLNDSQGGSECVVEIHGSFEQMDAAQNLLQTFVASSVQNFNGHQQQPPHSSAVQNFSAQPDPDPYASALQNSSTQQQQNPYASMHNLNAQQNQNVDMDCAAVNEGEVLVFAL
ncbi:hypothetical protein IFM89_016208 [Coptis chinensis]|uniref:K Homology domain-containing protein n=1 Tax=Coptis chinensis TaxID=261450 RepID=A0A835LEJ3_9MAGN|nr:hypothetical protein IFM89_016208 [Coptis chinensis]